MTTFETRPEPRDEERSARRLRATSFACLVLAAVLFPLGLAFLPLLPLTLLVAAGALVGRRRLEVVPPVVDERSLMVMVDDGRRRSRPVGLIGIELGKRPANSALGSLTPVVRRAEAAWISGGSIYVALRDADRSVAALASERLVAHLGAAGFTVRRAVAVSFPADALTATALLDLVNGARPRTRPDIAPSLAATPVEVPVPREEPA